MSDVFKTGLCFFSVEDETEIVLFDGSDLVQGLTCSLGPLAPYIQQQAENIS